VSRKGRPRQPKIRLGGVEVTEKQYERLDAFFREGTFVDAARVLGCDRKTVAATFRRFAPALRELIAASVDPPQTPE
jgi:hypothetical protein